MATCDTQIASRHDLLSSCGSAVYLLAMGRPGKGGTAHRMIENPALQLTHQGVAAMLSL